TAAAATAVAAATTAAATAAAAVTTAAAAATVAAATTATGAVGLGLGFVDSEVAAIDFLLVQGVDRGLGLGVTAHLDKAETLAAAGVPVVDDFGAGDSAVLAEHLFEVGAGGVVAEIAYV